MMRWTVSMQSPSGWCSTYALSCYNLNLGTRQRKIDSDNAIRWHLFNTIVIIIVDVQHARSRISYPPKPQRCAYQGQSTTQGRSGGPEGDEEWLGVAGIAPFVFGGTRIEAYMACVQSRVAAIKPAWTNLFFRHTYMHVFGVIVQHNRRVQLTVPEPVDCRYRRKRLNWLCSTAWPCLDHFADCLAFTHTSLVGYGSYKLPKLYAIIIIYLKNNEGEAASAVTNIEVETKNILKKQKQTRSIIYHTY